MPRSRSVYTAAVVTLSSRAVFTGTGCAQGFCPRTPIDRKTMAIWIVRVLDGGNPPLVSESRFDDVNPTGVYAPFIERMAELGVTTGCGDGSGYCPDGTVKRAQMAVFLARAYQLAEGPDPGFVDVPPGAWYADSVARLAASGITAGCGDGSGFCPGDDVTPRPDGDLPTPSRNPARIHVEGSTGAQRPTRGQESNRNGPRLELQSSSLSGSGTAEREIVGSGQITAQAEVDRNYDAFVELLPGLMRTHANKWALLHDGELTAVFDTARDAHLAGVKLYPNARYSVQEVTDRPVDLGWFSHAVS